MPDKSTNDCITQIGEVLMDEASKGNLERVDEIICSLTFVMRAAMDVYGRLHSGEIH